MKTYPLLECTISLRGSAQTELGTVTKTGIDRVTPPELAVLVILHGDDAVKDIKWTGEIEVSAEEIYDRLMSKYDPDKVAALFPAMHFMPDKAPDNVPYTPAKVAKAEVPEDDDKKARRKALADRYEQATGSRPHNFWSAEKIQQELDALPATKAA